MGRKRINLALQGGGSHGAFTWGVLDRLLEDERIEIEGISGTSAGAMNAGAVLQGYRHGGRPGARAALDGFWHRIAELAAYSPIRRSLADHLMGNWNLDQASAYFWADSLARLFSPYELNPGDLNPLRDFVHSVFDENAIRSAESFKLFVSATNARTGELRVFKNSEITADVFLASACLPLVFRAVEIDGEPYWDGGYMGNPPLFPLVEECDSGDIVIVQINPLTRDRPLHTASAILNRLNEITMNASLRHELRLIGFIQRLIASGGLSGEATKLVRKTHLHMIAAEDVMVQLGVASKMSGERAFFEYLKEVGRASADTWLASNFASLGLRSTIELDASLPAAPARSKTAPADRYQGAMADTKAQ